MPQIYELDKDNNIIYPESTNTKNGKFQKGNVNSKQNTNANNPQKIASNSRAPHYPYTMGQNFMQPYNLPQQNNPKTFILEDEHGQEITRLVTSPRLPPPQYPPPIVFQPNFMPAPTLIPAPGLIPAPNLIPAPILVQSAPLITDPNMHIIDPKSTFSSNSEAPYSKQMFRKFKNKL